MQWHCVLALSMASVGGCSANGDFGRVRPSLVSDNMHAWIGADAARYNGAPVSHFSLTEDEQLLRELAYPLIEPPYDRQRWYSVLGEYGVVRTFRPTWWHIDRVSYAKRVDRHHRSASGRYAQLSEDIRNDIVRIDPFFSTARRVLDMDRKREKSLAYLSELSDKEQCNALARIGENTFVVQWVHRSLLERAAAYRYALERLVIANPSPLAVEAEQVLNQLQMRIAEGSFVAPLQIGGTARVAGHPARREAGPVVAKY
jgi:hypothetical protein